MRPFNIPSGEEDTERERHVQADQQAAAVQRPHHLTMTTANLLWWARRVFLKIARTIDNPLILLQRSQPSPYDL